MRGDGDGWVVGSDGSRRWGRYGAAGLVLRCPGPDGSPLVLLQHRVWWSHQGGTWGVPGGARDSHETPAEAAVREAGEEAGISADDVTVRAIRVTADLDSGRWTYTSVLAETASPLPTAPSGESAELRWVPEGEVASYRLHPGFGSSWPVLRIRRMLAPRDVLARDGTLSDAGAPAAPASDDRFAVGPARLIELSDGFGWLP